MQDPVWRRSGGTDGWDGSRVPLPWEGELPPFGFSSSEATWLPMPPDWSGLTVEAQDGVDASTLSLFRRAIELRHRRGDLGEGIEWQEAPEGVLAFRGADGVVCVLNAGISPAPLPEGAVLIASAEPVDGALPPDAAAWIG